MKILVTGATSNVGTEVALKLQARGHAVRGIALPGLPRELLDQAAIPLSFVDVTDAAALAPAFDGVDAVVHCAGVVEFHKSSRERLFRVNVDGARNCARAAAKAGARWFVHLSSVSVYGLLGGRVRVDESMPQRHSGVAYNDSKREGEAAVRAELGGLALTVLQPVGIYGIYDRLVLRPSIDSIRSGRYAYLGDHTRPLNLIGAGYLAEAIARILDRPAPASPQTFIASEGPPPSAQRFFETVASEFGITRAPRTVPLRGVHALSFISGVMERFGKKGPGDLTSGLLANALVDAVFDGSALRRHLDLQELDPLEGVRSTMAQLRRDGRFN